MTIWGKEELGLTVLSDGKSNPISLIFVFLIFPIELLETSRIAPDPESVKIFAIPGRE